MTIFLCPEKHSGQRKKMDYLCALCGSAVKHFPFDFHRFEAELR